MIEDLKYFNSIVYDICTLVSKKYYEHDYEYIIMVFRNNNIEYTYKNCNEIIDELRNRELSTFYGFNRAKMISYIRKLKLKTII